MLSSPLLSTSDASLSMASCRLAASELQSSFKKACQFYRMVSYQCSNLFLYSLPVNCCTEKTHLTKHCVFTLCLQLSSSIDERQEHQEMAKVLTEAFEAVQAELNSLPHYIESRSSSSSSVCALGSGAGGVGEERTLALLEQYSQLLLRAVEKRMDSKS